MAKLALTLTLFIALFIFTRAKHPLDLPDDDSSSTHHPSITLPEPESKRTILLPSENPESEHLTLVELEPHEEEAHVMDNEHEAEEMVEEVEEEAVHPEKRFVWTRDGDERRMFMPRHPHHRCHHPDRRPFEGKGPMPEFERTERSYWNDMLIAEPEPEPEKEKMVEKKMVSFADDMLMEKGLKGRTVSFGNDMLVADPEAEKGLKGKAVSFGYDMLMAEPEIEKGLEGRTVSYGNDMLVAKTEGEKGYGGLEEDLTEVKMGGNRHAPSRWVGLHFDGGSRFDPEHEHEHGPHHHHHHHHDHRDEDDERRPDGHRLEDERRPDGHRHGRREEGGGGLVKRFRKFLHHIDF